MSVILDREKKTSKWRKENVIGTFSVKSEISHDLSKINYLKTSSVNAAKHDDMDITEVEETLTDSDNCSHVLYDTIADKFCGVPNFDRELHWTNVHLSGNWGSHAYEYTGWEDEHKYVFKRNHYQDLVLTDEENEGLLTDRIIAICSSYFDRSPETGEYVLCKCILTSKGLVDITALKKYHYIQYLDISKNRIVSLAALDQLPFLMYLDASNNFLTEILDFKAPFNLMFVNLCSNDIKTMRDLSDFWSIIVLDLSNNEIEAISGLQNLRHLRGLNLSYNWISKFEGLNNLERLQCLNLYNNVISDFEVGPNVGLKTMIRLKKVSFARNRLTTLQIIEEARLLQWLDLSENKLEDIHQLMYLKDLTNLNELDLRENPICSNLRYYDTCVNYCKYVFVLDGEEVRAETKVLCRKKFEASVFEYGKPGSQHMLLTNINFPYITKSIVPYTHPPRPIIVLVGPPSCLKGFLVDLACEIFSKYLTRGVNHTTRPRTKGEIDGEQYHFVTYETFKDMMRRGLFYTTAEYFGYLYGFAYSEMAKMQDEKSVLIVHSDLNGALLLRARGLRPTLVLTLPRSEDMHLKFLKKKYFCHSLAAGILEIGMSSTKLYEGLIRTKKFSQRQMITTVKKMLEELFKEDSKEKLKDSEINPDAHISSMTLSKLIEETERCGQEHERRKSAVINYENSATKQQKDIGDFILPGWFLFKNDERHDDMLCLSNISQKPIEGLKKVKIDDVIRSYMELDTINKPAEEEDYTTKKKVMYDIQDDDEVQRESSSGSVVREFSEGKEEEEDVDSENIQGVGQKVESEPILLTLKRKSALHKLFDNIIESRKMYLEMHWANPGLFAQVLFTDDLNQGLDILTEVLKSCVKTYHLRSPVCKIQHDPKKHPLVLERLKILRATMLPQGLAENERKNCRNN